MNNIEDISRTVIDSLQQQQTAPAEKAAVTKKITEALALLQNSVEKKKFKNRFKIDLDALSASEQVLINKNLDDLALPAHVGDLLLELRDLKKSVIEQLGDTIEDGTELILPTNLASNMSRNQKIATGVAGAGLLVAGMALLAKGKATVKKFLVKTAKYALLAAVPVSIFFGPQIKKWLEAKLAIVMQSEVKQKISDVTQGVRDKVGGIVDYFLGVESDEVADETKKNAEEAYRTSKPENREAAVRIAFGLQPNETTPAFREFMDTMEKKYEILVKDDVQYATTEVARSNIEFNLKTIVNQIEEWVEDHAVETTVLGYFSYRLGILKASLAASGAASTKALAIAGGLAKFGLKHPLLSAMIVGGGIGAKTFLNSKYEYCAENLHEVAKSGKKNVSPFLDDKKTPIEIPAVQKEHLQRMAELPGNLANISSEQIHTFLTEILESAPEALAIEDDEYILMRNVAGIHEFYDYWSDMKDSVNSSIELRVRIPVIKAILKKIEAFEAQHTAFLHGEATSSDVQKEFTTLQAAVAAKPFSMKLLKENGLLKWTQEDGRTRDLCVDHAIADKDEQLERSHDIYLNESGASFSFMNGVQQLQSDIAHSQDTYSNIFGWEVGDWSAMAIGGVLYAVDLQNPKKYYQLTKSLVGEFGSTSWEEWLGIHGRATAVGGMMLLSGGLLKKAIIGGELLIKVRSLRTLGHLTPGVQQVLMARSAALSLRELDMFTRGLSYSLAREYNTVLRMAGLQPEMIHYIESGNVEEMHKIAEKLGLKRLPKTTAGLQTKLRIEFKEALKNVEVRDFNTWKVWKWFSKGKYARDNIGLYKDIAASYAKRPPPAIYNLLNEPARLTRKGIQNILQRADVIALVKQLKIPMAQFTSYVHKIGMSPAVAKAFANSRAMSASLVQACKNGGIVAMRQTAQIGQKAVQLFSSPLGRTIGKYGTLAGLDLLFYKLEAGQLDAQIAATNNQGLQNLYEGKKDVAANRAILNATLGGTTIAGESIAGAVSSTLGSNATLLGMQLATVGNPVVLSMIVGLPAIATADYAANKMNAVSEGWLKNADDWQNKTTGEMLQTMRSVAPGQQSYWSQAARGNRMGVWYNWATSTKEEYDTWEKQQFKGIEDSNTSQREEVTRAYCVKQSFLSPLQNESPKDYKERFQRMQTHQLKFLSSVTDGSFAQLPPQNYEMAELHAEFAALGEVLQENGESILVPVNTGTVESPTYEEFDVKNYASLATATRDDPINRFTVLRAYADMKRDELLFNVYVSKESKANPVVRREKDFALQYALFNRLKHFIASVDARIVEANVTGLEWTGGEEGSRSIVRMIASNRIRRFLRKKSDEIWDAGADVTPEQFEAAVEEGIAMLHSMDPQALYEVKEKEYFNSEPMEQAQLYVDPQWMLQNLYLHSA